MLKGILSIHYESSLLLMFVFSLSEAVCKLLSTSIDPRHATCLAVLLQSLSTPMLSSSMVTHLPFFAVRFINFILVRKVKHVGELMGASFSASVEGIRNEVSPENPWCVHYFPSFFLSFFLSLFFLSFSLCFLWFLMIRAGGLERSTTESGAAGIQ